MLQGCELYSEGLVKEAFQSLIKGAPSDWPDLLLRLSASIPESPTAPVETVAQLQHLLKAPQFLALPDSWNLLHFVLTNWEWFSDPFRQTLASATARAFDRLDNFMGAFIAAEILGEKCANRWALERLVSLSRTADLAGRSLVPHGLQCLVRTTRDAALKAHALEALGELASSEVPEVSSEANAALLKLRCA